MLLSAVVDELRSEPGWPLLELALAPHDLAKFIAAGPVPCFLHAGRKPFRRERRMRHGETKQVDGRERHGADPRV